MAVGFKYEATDLDDIFLRTSEFTGAAVNSAVNSLSRTVHLINADTLSGVQGSAIRCSDCSWTCATICLGLVRK